MVRAEREHLLPNGAPRTDESVPPGVEPAAREEHIAGRGRGGKDECRRHSAPEDNPRGGEHRRARGANCGCGPQLLGHANHSMAGHCASADIGRLLTQANLVLNRLETCTVLRVLNG
jgi:hypothetical protein